MSALMDVSVRIMIPTGATQVEFLAWFHPHKVHNTLKSQMLHI